MTPTDSDVQSPTEFFLARQGTTALFYVSTTLAVVGLTVVVTGYIHRGEVRVPGLLAGVVGLCCLAMHKRVHPRVILRIILWAMGVVPILGGLMYAGLHANAVIVIPGTVAVATIFLGRRELLAMSLWLGFTLVLLYILEIRGSFPVVDEPPFGRLATLGGIMVGIGYAVGKISAAFKEQYSGFVTLFRSMPLPGSVQEEDGVLVDVSDAWVRTFGISRTTAVGQTAESLGLWVNPAELAQLKDDLRNHKQISPRPVELRTADGSTRHFMLNVAVVEFIGKKALLASLVDQTDRLSAEESQRQLNQKLATANQELESTVAARTMQLQQTVEKLKQTQEEMIQYGTLASLGAMVAGISHELNTPIGNALVATSTLTERMHQTKDAANNGSLKRSALDDFMGEAGELTSVVHRSLERAADLVKSFKQVSIDQTSERRRSFNLQEVTQNIVATLLPGLKHSPWKITIDIDIPPGIECDSYPGPLGQVTSNLIQNAALHAFEGREHGVIQIRAVLEAQDVVLSVSDNGKGMTPNVLAHAFDPFYTTRLGKGGSGLGLSVCKRIASTVLHGSLTAESVHGEGATFTLRFPQETPGKM